jgi:hypothetical protein
MGNCLGAVTWWNYTMVGTPLMESAGAGLSLTGVTFYARNQKVDATIASTAIGFGCQAYWIQNAPSIATSTSAIFTCGPLSAAIGSTTATAINIEFALFEFAGVTTSNEFVPDVFNATFGTASSTVNPGAVTTTAGIDLLFGAWEGQGATLAAGSGFTLGPTAVLATTGQSQYMLNAAGSGTYTASFGGSASYWAAVVIGLKAATSTAHLSYGFPTVIF